VSEAELALALEGARRALEAWQTYAALDQGVRALEHARALGRPEAVDLATILLARARLSVAREPLSIDLPEPSSQAPEVTAALARLVSERALASGVAPETTTLVAPALDDAIAAWVLAEVARPVPSWNSLPASLDHTMGDELGWVALARAVGAEADGLPSAPALESAIATARRTGARSVLAAALLTRIGIASARRAFRQERAQRLELLDLLESWALELTSTDASAALARPDRLRAAGSELLPVVGDARLARVALALSEETNLERLAALGLAAALEESGAERGALVLRDGPGQYRIKTHVANEHRAALVSVSTTIASQVIDAGEVVVSNDLTQDARLSQIKSLQAGLTSVLCVPAKTRAVVEGAIYLDRDARGRPFDESVVAAVSAIGSMLASALAMRRALSELEAKADELVVARAELSRHLAARTDEVERLQKEVGARRGERGGQKPLLVGSSPAMARLRDAIARLGPSDAPVFVAGETGTGKEVVARSLHFASRRAAGPFVAINCGAFGESLLEAELFGAERGAYTGAAQAREGLFEAADGGTLLLDEVGDMPPPMQVALLRVLETSEVRRVGSTKLRKVDVRILSASHKNLDALVQAGKFRADLRFRLEVVRIDVPPLRERLEDLPALAEHLLLEATSRYLAPPRTLSRAALEALRMQSFPGNVRELRHFLTSAALSAAGPQIEPRDLPRLASLPPHPSAETSPGAEEARASNIRAALRATAGHRGKAAELLGVSRATFYRHLELHGIDPREYEGVETGE
jgi:DNA-binding NtrC family response regulator